MNHERGMNMKRLAVALVAGAAVSTLAYASASVLNVDGGTIQAGADSKLSCDADGVKANWGLETDDNSVRSVRVSGISADCAGTEMFVAVNGNRVGAGEIPTPTTAGQDVQFTVKLAQPMTPESIENIKIWIEG